MNEKNTGGNAFPHFSKSRQHSSDGYAQYQGIDPGMTLRDYFAAKCMQGVQANSDESACAMGFEQIAKFSYEMADAMLKAREGA